ncbi:NAD(P) transhydrogenase subunit alpha [Cyanobium sp. PCC 7001]|uniref:NAD(P) transhydrogenase subunit alpha n=1 Tax=Cyanobium sp. PCC 7001 TaxID=180281 RepID=UPI00067FECF2
MEAGPCEATVSPSPPQLLIPREYRPGEARVAATPETVQRLTAKGLRLAVEAGAGEPSGFQDRAYAEAGAELLSPETPSWEKVDGVLCVQPPAQERLEQLRPGALLVGLLAPYGADALVGALNRRQVSAMALELLPRTSRAQTMDVLSSQANIAGYKAVLLAAAALDRYVPMLMTAAGTIQPARTLILGAGVAGLQALATARRLGSVVYVSDVRPAAREQVESLGGRFVAPPELGDTPAEVGGYAQAATEAFLAAQRQQLEEQLAQADMVICTAQVPGRPAPRLISEAMLDRLRPGSVVVDLAVGQGGNCACTVAGQTVLRNGVQLIGADALPSSVPNHASALYARNVAALLEHLLTLPSAEAEVEAGLQGFSLNREDPIVAGCLITHAGRCWRPDVVGVAAEEPQLVGAGA